MYNTVLFGIKNGLSNFSVDITLIVLFSVLTLATVLVAVWLINLSIGKKQTKSGLNHLFGIMMVLTLVGVAIRIVLAILITGHKSEFFEIAGENGIVWNILNDGFGGYYLDKEDGLIYPFALYLFSLFATLGSWFGMTSTSFITPLVIKAPLILADIGCIILLYRIGKKYFSAQVGVIISGLYSLCPVFMFPSAVWGSLYAVLAFLLLLTFYLLAEKRFFFMFVSFSFAMLTAKEAIFLFPVIGVFVIYRFIQSIKLNRREKRDNPLSFGELLKSSDRGLVVRLPIYFVICLIGMYLISLPFVLADYGGNFFVWLNEFYLKGLTKVAYYGYNSLSLYNIFNMNGSLFGTDLVPLFVVLFLAIIVALTLMYYLSKKNRANLVMLGAFIYMTLSIFFVDFREMTAFPVLIILLLAFILIKDKRLLQVFCVYAVIFVLNASVVMASSGYFNNISEAAFYSNNDYYGTTLLSSTTGKIINIALSALAVLAYIHFTFILMDISMNMVRKPFEGQKRLSPLTAMKCWFKK